MSEHLTNSHHCIFSHLKHLFCFMFNHSFVPDSFTHGIIIPVLKDKRGDHTVSQNYRPITLCSIISKVFEYYLLDKYSTFMISHELQFGFKPKIGCANAIFFYLDVLWSILMTMEAMSIWLH